MPTRRRSRRCDRLIEVVERIDQPAQCFGLAVVHHRLQGNRRGNHSGRRNGFGGQALGNPEQRPLAEAARRRRDGHARRHGDGLRAGRRARVDSRDPRSSWRDLRASPFLPSPGTPGEGWGGGFPRSQLVASRARPFPGRAPRAPRSRLGPVPQRARRLWVGQTLRSPYPTP